MTRILIPRSDNLSAKVIEASDWEKYFKDVIRDYIVCGFNITSQSPNVLAVNVSTGSARLKGLYIEGTTTDTVTCLTACATNYIYASLCRDPSCEPQAWVFAKNTTGTTPACSMILGTVTTGSSTVTSINQTVDNSYCGNGVEGLFRTASSSGEWFFGNGADGNLTISTNTTITEVKYYNNLTITSGAVVSFNYQPALMYVRGTLNICNGTISVNGLGSAGGSGGSTSGGAGGRGQTYSQPSTQGSPGSPGTPGQPGTGGAGGGAGGNAGSGTPGGSSGNGGGGGNSPYASSGGGTGVNPSPGGSGGSGGSAGTLPREFNSIFDYLSKDSRQTAAGGGGGGGGSTASGAGGGGGVRMGPAQQGGNGGNGGTGGSSQGGSGGAGGGTLVILANDIVIGTCGVLTSNGNSGSAGVANSGSGGGSAPGQHTGGGGGGGAAGGVGGGGGGGGGALVLIYKSLTNNGSYQAAGGAGGSGSTSGGAGGAGGSAYYSGGAGQPGGAAPGSNSGQPGGTGLLITNKIT